VGLGPTAVVRLERALAHSWAPGLLAGAWGTGCRSCVARQGAWVWMVGRLRARDPTGAGTPQRPSTNATRPRYGGPAGRVKPGCPGPAGSTGTAHRPTSGAHPRAPGDRHAAGPRKTARPGCGQPLAGGPPASLVSRESPGSSPPVVRGISPHQSRGSGHTGATDVHRLWTTVWTVRSGALGEPCRWFPPPTQTAMPDDGPTTARRCPLRADPGRSPTKRPEAPSAPPGGTARDR
jgi:hypothetical protein